MNEPADVPVGIRSIYGAATRRGLVGLTVSDQETLITPAKAREIASMLLEAAGAAEGDEVLMTVLDRAGLSPQRSAQVLVAMRQERTILERKARQEMRRAIAEDQEAADLGN